MLRYIFISSFIFIALMNLSAQKIRENTCVGITNGLVIPGPLSHGGSNFIGYKREIFVGYVWPSAKSPWGIETDLGWTKIKYISRFDNNFTLYHRQSLATINLMGFVKISTSLRLEAGLNSFSPIYYMVIVGNSRNSNYYNFSNDDLLKGYDPTPIQAGAAIGIEYLIGKKQNWNLGLFVNQMGNGPVQSDRDFSNLGIPVSISSKLRPMHFDFRIAFHFSGKKKDRDNPNS